MPKVEEKTTPKCQTTAISWTQLLNELCTAELHLWRSRLVLLLRSAWQHRLGSSALYLSCFSLSSTYRSYRWARICNGNGLNSPKSRFEDSENTKNWFKKICSQFNCAIFLKLPPSLQVFVTLDWCQSIANGIVQPLPWSEGLCKRGNFCVSTCFHIYHWIGFLVFSPEKPSFLQSHSDTFRGFSSNFPSRHGKMQMAQSPMLHMSEPRGTGGELTWSNTKTGLKPGTIWWDNFLGYTHMYGYIYIYQTNRTTGSFNGPSVWNMWFQICLLKALK